MGTSAAGATLVFWADEAIAAESAAEVLLVRIGTIGGLRLTGPGPVAVAVGCAPIVLVEGFLGRVGDPVVAGASTAVFFAAGAGSLVGEDDSPLSVAANEVDESDLGGACVGPTVCALNLGVVEVEVVVEAVAEEEVLEAGVVPAAAP